MKSGTVSFGHRFLGGKPFIVSSANLRTFEQLLKKRHVILSFEDRRKKINASLKGTHNQNEALVRTVSRLVEEPFSIHGSFEKKYLELPHSVLTTCMSKHQRVFACFDAKERLKNKFVAFINGPRKNVKHIVQNYEGVLRSRLADAQFFFLEDRKSKLDSKVGRLEQMVFLGS